MDVLTKLAFKAGLPKLGQCPSAEHSEPALDKIVSTVTSTITRFSRRKTATAASVLERQKEDQVHLDVSGLFSAHKTR